MKTYTEEEKEKIGTKIIEIFELRKSVGEKGRYKTRWGSKTPVGIFNTFMRIAKDIQEGKKIE
jgi:hypothetical protein